MFSQDRLSQGTCFRRNRFSKKRAFQETGFPRRIKIFFQGRAFEIAVSEESYFKVQHF